MISEDFGRAVRIAGATVNLAGEKDAAFAASIQPENLRGDGRHPAGVGFLLRYKFFAEYNKASKSLDVGDKIESEDMLFRIEHIRTRFLGDNPIYREGIVIMEEDSLSSKA